jgi:hypothetical protein
MTEIENFTVSIDADTSAFRREINAASSLANGFGRAMTKAFEGSILRGRDFGDVMRSLALQLSNLAVNAAFKPLEQGMARCSRACSAASAAAVSRPWLRPLHRAA